MPINIVYTISLTTNGTRCYSWRPTSKDRKPKFTKKYNQLEKYELLFLENYT